MVLQKDTVAKLIINILTKNFTSSKLVDNNTQLKKHLRTDDGFGQGSSKNVFMGLIEYNFNKSGYAKPSWPSSDWMEMTVGELAEYLAERAEEINL